MLRIPRHVWADGTNRVVRRRRRDLEFGDCVAMRTMHDVRFDGIGWGGGWGLVGLIAHTLCDKAQKQCCCVLCVLARTSLYQVMMIGGPCVGVSPGELRTYALYDSYTNSRSLAVSSSSSSLLCVVAPARGVSFRMDVCESSVCPLRAPFALQVQLQLHSQIHQPASRTDTHTHAHTRTHSLTRAHTYVVRWRIRMCLSDVMRDGHG